MTDPTQFFNEVFVAGAEGGGRADFEYEPYAAVKRLLRERATSFKGGPAALMRACGWNKSDPREIVTRWTSLRGRIPAAILTVLRIEHDIEIALAADVAAFETALLHLPEIDHFVERLLPALYRHRAFPHRMNAADAIAFVREHAQRAGLQCSIDLGVRTTYVRPDGSFWDDPHRPSKTEQGIWLYFADAGNRFGKIEVA